MSAIPVLSSEFLCAGDSVSHGFFTRRGGVSSGVFGSLNCSLSSGDDGANVLENRSRVARKLGCDQVVSLRQIHSRRVYVVDDVFDTSVIREGDGLVTASRGVAIGVLGADCAPVLFSDFENGVIGAAHGGWKGAVAGITDEVIAKMESLGAQRPGIVAAIGPSIQRDSYEVGPEFPVQVRENSDFACEDCFSGGGGGSSLYFDLPLYLRKKLMAAGISVVDCLDEDTYSNENDFFSYRRACHLGERQFGCQIGAIALRD